MEGKLLRVIVTTLTPHAHHVPFIRHSSSAYGSSRRGTCTAVWIEVAHISRGRLVRTYPWNPIDGTFRHLSVLSVRERGATARVFPIP